MRRWHLAKKGTEWAGRGGGTFLAARQRSPWNGKKERRPCDVTRTRGGSAASLSLGRRRSSRSVHRARRLRPSLLVPSRLVSARLSARQRHRRRRRVSLSRRRFLARRRAFGRRGKIEKEKADNARDSSIANGNSSSRERQVSHNGRLLCDRRGDAKSIAIAAEVSRVPRRGLFGGEEFLYFHIA